MKGNIDYLQKTSRRSKYGFIRGENDKMYWFSLDDLRKIKVGDAVQFTEGRDDKGYIASQVLVI